MAGVRSIVLKKPGSRFVVKSGPDNALSIPKLMFGVAVGIRSDAVERYNT